jgi:hypothetical protein
LEKKFIIKKGPEKQDLSKNEPSDPPGFVFSDVRIFTSVVHFAPPKTLEPQNIIALF